MEIKWTLCKDELPTANGRYLVTYLWQDMTDTTIDEYRKGEWVETPPNTTVIAWAELPEPYKEHQITSMSVKELMEKLQQFDENRQIVIYDEMDRPYEVRDAVVLRNNGMDFSYIIIAPYSQ